MSILVSSLQTIVEDKFGLSHSQEGAKILTYLTKGYRLLLNETAFYTASTTISLSNGTNEYQLDTTVEEIRDLTVDGSLVKAQFVPRETILDLRRYANSGVAGGDVYSYNIEGNLLMIYPTPTTSGTMTIYHIPQATLSDFAGTENLVTDLHCIPVGPIAEALEYYACWQVAEYDDKSLATNAVQYKQWWLEAKTNVLKAVRKRGHRTPAQARVGYPSRAGYPRRNDVFPEVPRQTLP